MSEPVRYADIPQTMRDLLDEVYTPEGVVIFWNARIRPLDEQRPADLWQTVEGRERIRSWIEYLTGGGW